MCMCQCACAHLYYAECVTTKKITQENKDLYVFLKNNINFYTLKKYNAFMCLQCAYITLIFIIEIA